MLIEAKVKVARETEGKIRKKTETYLVDVEFYANVEYLISQLMEDEQAQSYEIQSLKISGIKEIDTQSFDETKPSFIATLKDVFLETDGTEKQMKYKVLLWADNLTVANQRTLELAHQGYNMLIEGIKQVDYIYITNND